MTWNNLNNIFDRPDGAVLSVSGVYRYLLWREWRSGGPKAWFVMLNPSTADAEKDDPTIRRCIGFAKSFGYGGLAVTNLFAFRATSPADLIKVNWPFGSENMDCHRALCNSSHVSGPICAWGAKGIYKNAGPSLIRFFKENAPDIFYLDVTKNGQPKHPLYLKKTMQLKRHYPVNMPLIGGR